MKCSSRWSSILNSLVIALIAAGSISAQSPRVPKARLIPASRLQLPGDIDSNNPAIWSLVDGVRRLFVISSWGGVPTRSSGAALASLRLEGPVGFSKHPGHGVWIESIVPDDTGTWYAYYHHERDAGACGRPDRQLPRIGALRSPDRGVTWHDLGIVLDAPPGTDACESANRFVLGGVGDVTAALDAEKQDVYLYFSQYSRKAWRSPGWRGRTAMNRWGSCSSGATAPGCLIRESPARRWSERRSRFTIDRRPATCSGARPFTGTRI